MSHVQADEVTLFEDDRGSFQAWFGGQAGFADLDPKQANVITSRLGAVRGAHYTAVPPGQQRLFCCVHGVMLAAVIDIQVGSPTFAGVTMHELDASRGSRLYVPEGFATAFMSLSEPSVMVYLCSREFDPALERGLDPMDPALGIPWPTDIAHIVSAKDSSAPTLAEARERNQLPPFAPSDDDTAG